MIYLKCVEPCKGLTFGAVYTEMKRSEERRSYILDDNGVYRYYRTNRFVEQ